MYQDLVFTLLQTELTAVSDYKSHTRHFGQVQAHLKFTEKAKLSAGYNGLPMRTQKKLIVKSCPKSFLAHHTIQIVFVPEYLSCADIITT